MALITNYVLKVAAMKKELDLKKIILTLIGFIVLWAIVSNAWGYSDYLLKNDTYNIGMYVYGYISRFIWVIPAILLIIKYSNNLYFKAKELFAPPKFNKTLLLVIAISLIYIAISMLIIHNGFHFNSNVNLGLVLLKYIIVGFVEETVFRGWGYNSLAKILSHRKATIITTIFFIILHWPSYFIKMFRFGVFDFAGIIVQSISALVWGFVFCLLLKKGKSIWNPIVTHIIYDLMYVLLVGGT